MTNVSDGQQVLVLFVVPGSELRSLLGTTAPSPRQNAGHVGNGTNGRQNKAAPKYVIESLSVDALETLLKRQGDQVLVFHPETGGHRPAGTGVQDMLDALLSPPLYPASPAGDDRQDEDSLSRREMEVLALVAEGAGNSELSDTLCITLNTVKSHMKSIMRKLRTKDRNQTALVGRIIFGVGSPNGSGPE